MPVTFYGNKANDNSVDYIVFAITIFTGYQNILPKSVSS